MVAVETARQSLQCLAGRNGHGNRSGKRCRGRPGITDARMGGGHARLGRGLRLGDVLIDLPLHLLAQHAAQEVVGKAGGRVAPVGQAQRAAGGAGQ